MSEFEDLLGRLKREPAPHALALIEKTVLARVSQVSFKHEPFSFRVVAVAMALVMGIAGGILPSLEGRDRDAIVPLGEAMEFAPSTLLAADR